MDGELTSGYPAIVDQPSRNHTKQTMEITDTFRHVSLNEGTVRTCKNENLTVMFRNIYRPGHCCTCMPNGHLIHFYILKMDRNELLHVG